MSNEPEISFISDPADPRLDQLLPMFEDLHAVMNRHGMLLELAPNGAKIWLDSFRTGLERFGRMVIAEADGKVIGFTCGSMKLAPEYLGGERIGHWTHLYVGHAHRLSGVARRMTGMLHEWFAEKGIRNIETQVVVEHPSSVPFVGSFGYQMEWFNFRKLT
jgi:GNAT superfamily N-acetyltransferase